jgi:cell division protein FtsB
MNPDNITDFELHCSNQDLGPGGYNLSCITTVPQEHCWCKSTNPEEIIGTCMHPNCGEGLCFKTAVSPVSDLHGFSHMGKAGLTVIALMFQKNWSEMMDLCVQAAGAMFGYTYYFLVVIFGSFCLLNLTVATVGQTYTRVKKLSEAKKAKKEAEIAQREKIQAERDEMKEKQRAEKKAAGGDEDDEDDADEVDLLFDQVRARLYWGLGLVGVPFAHRIYFKGWYEGWFFVLRCVTLNYFYVGWIIDGLALDTVNQVASEAEVERRQVAIDKRKEHLDSEISRIESLMLDPQIMKLSVFLSYPTKDFPCMYSRQVLENQYNKFKAENPKAFPASETDVGNMDDLAGLEDDDSEESSEGGEDVETSTSEEGGQSHFAWFADFVVIANAGTLAMTGFNDHWNPLLEAVGYFASIFFIVEAMVKSKAYGGWSYYLTDSSNVFDFTLVVIPTIGEVKLIPRRPLDLSVP